MTEIEELILAAEAQKRKCLKPKPETQLSKRSWQELLDGKPYPNIRKSNL